MKVRATCNLSMNREGDTLGIDPTLYVLGEVYDISEELYEDNTDHFTAIGLEVEEEVSTDAQSIRRELVEDNKRPALDAMAEDLGLNPDDYNNKTQVAEAIVEARAKDANE